MTQVVVAMSTTLVVVVDRSCPRRVGVDPEAVRLAWALSCGFNR